jgi:hypothetical protein
MTSIVRRHPLFSGQLAHPAAVHLAIADIESTHAVLLRITAYPAEQSPHCGPVPSSQHSVQRGIVASHRLQEPNCPGGKIVKYRNWKNVGAIAL